METFRKDNTGFSFIEIFVVIILIAIASSITLINTEKTYKHLSNETGALSIYGDICDARNYSIISLTQTRVRFFMNYNNTGKSAYFLQKLENNVWSTYKRVILPETIRIGSVNFSGNTINQVFSFNGTPSNIGNVSIIFNETKVMQIVFYTSGRIRVKEIDN